VCFDENIGVQSEREQRFALLPSGGEEKARCLATAFRGKNEGRGRVRKKSNEGVHPFKRQEG